MMCLNSQDQRDKIEIHQSEEVRIDQTQTMDKIGQITAYEKLEQLPAAKPSLAPIVPTTTHTVNKAEISKHVSMLDERTPS